MKTVYLLLGSNLGDRENNLCLAAFEVSLNVGPVINASGVYESKAWGGIEQPDFYNQAIKILTAMPPETLLQTLKEIEKSIGRTDSEKWGPRLIDIDILYYEKKILNEEDLVLPHPFLHERRFALTPLVEISPNFVHPVLQLSNKTLLQDCPDFSEVNKLPLFIHRQKSDSSIADLGM